MNGPAPDKVMQLITGSWAASILGAAARHGVFTALEGNPDTAEGMAKRTGISTRGAQALLDGLTGVTGHQLDWPNVNAIAREFVARFGVADRFRTIDGDFHTTDFGAAKYDFAVYSHVAHQEAPADNVAVFRKFRESLKPGGTLVVNDFILNDDRTGHPFAMLFASQMLVVTKNGFTYRQSDYRSWLSEAGFTSIEVVATPTPASMVFARSR